MAVDIVGKISARVKRRSRTALAQTRNGRESRRMRRPRSGPFLAVAAAALVLAAPAAAADRTLTVTPGAPQSWTSRDATGNNQAFDPQTGTPCNHAGPASECDSTLLNVNVPASFWDNQGGGVDISATGFTQPNADFDVYVYRSNAAGAPLQLVAASAGAAGQEERAAPDVLRGDRVGQVDHR